MKFNKGATVKNLILIVLFTAIASPAMAADFKRAQDMTAQEYHDYINARNNDPAWHEQLKARADQYLEQSARAARGEKVMTTQEAYDAQKAGAVYQEQENPNDPRLDSPDFQNYLKEKADELDKSE